VPERPGEEGLPAPDGTAEDDLLAVAAVDVLLEHELELDVTQLPLARMRDAMRKRRPA
jgi:hypothetical protein